MFPEIILGSPGCGKTTALLNELEKEMTSGTEPERIAYVSFTRKAASEAASRAASRFSLDKDRLRHFRTLHSMCFHALGLSNSDVFEGRRVAEFGEWIGYDVSESRFSEDGILTGYTPADRALFMENLARVREVELREQYEQFDDNLPWAFVDRISRGLRKFKLAQGLLDYTDMLQRFADNEEGPDLEVLMIDESQDLSALQWAVVRKLARDVRRVVIAGDDDQSIYRWAGADIEHFIDMPGQSRVLGQSWRCPPVVQQLSQELIQRVTHRRPKVWSPREGDEGVLERLTSMDHVDLWGSKDILILARNTYLLKPVTDALRQDGVIYEQHNHTSVSQGILDAVRWWEKMRRGESITVDEARHVYHYLSSGSGVKRGYKTLPGYQNPAEMVSLADLQSGGGLVRTEIWHEALDRIPREDSLYMLRALQKGESLTLGRARVRVSTIHGAKGGEADHVVVLSDLANRTYDEFRRNPEDEARVFYVAVTRAKRQLTIIGPRTGQYYDV